MTDQQLHEALTKRLLALLPHKTKLLGHQSLVALHGYLDAALQHRKAQRWTESRRYLEAAEQCVSELERA